MIHALIYHGFPLCYKAGRKERSIYHSLINQIDEKFHKNKNLIINGTWLDWPFQHACDALLKVYQPDNVFICSLGDPWEMDAWAIEKFPNSSIYLIGNMDSQYHFNFWAIHFLQDAPMYDECDLMLDDDCKLFLCYQNKPHFHRQLFTHKLLQNNLIDLGHVTLNGTKEQFQFASLSRRSNLPMSKGGHFEDDGLGDLKIWQNCYYNIVSETVWNDHTQVFVSEKTWKPILGMRPFLIIGNPGIYDYLETHGFDTFDDVFPVRALRQTRDASQIIQLVINFLNESKQIPVKDLKQQWLDLLPRMRYNRDRMIRFAQEQNYCVHHLFEEQA